VVVTAASVPEREASKQVLSFGLPDGIKGFTAVFDRLSIEVTAAISFSNRWWIAWDGWFRWFYDSNRPKALF
jgi:hypothetical protein